MRSYEFAIKLAKVNSTYQVQSTVDVMGDRCWHARWNALCASPFPNWRNGSLIRSPGQEIRRKQYHRHSLPRDGCWAAVVVLPALLKPHHQSYCFGGDVLAYCLWWWWLLWWWLCEGFPYLHSNGCCSVYCCLFCDCYWRHGVHRIFLFQLERMALGKLAYVPADQCYLCQMRAGRTQCQSHFQEMQDHLHQAQRLQRRTNIN